MQTDKPSSNNRSADPGEAASVGVPAMSSEALARRRMLLKSLGKGAAVAAAAVPIQTLAAPVTTGGKLCTLSGNMSNVAMSRAPISGSSTCGGYKPTHWQYTPPSAPTNWPAGQSHTVAFNSIFTSTIATSIGDIINGGPTEEQVWVTAYLNSISGDNGFPYGNVDVVAFYNNLSPFNSNTTTTVRQAAYEFFSGYMQHIP